MQNIKNRETDLLHYCLSVNSQHGCFRRNKRARHLHRLLNIISQVLAICGWWASSGMRHLFVFDLFWYYFPLWICQLTFWARNNTCLGVLIFFFFMMMTVIIKGGVCHFLLTIKKIHIHKFSLSEHCTGREKKYKSERGMPLSMQENIKE